MISQFNYSGASQPLTLLPAAYMLVVCGAQGGNANNAAFYSLDDPGRGGCVYASVNITKSENWVLFVGGQGGDGSSIAGLGGFNGGGSGGIYNGTNYYQGVMGHWLYAGGGGGGSTHIVSASGDVLVVAGGGGGVGKVNIKEFCKCDGNGGDGGGFQGGNATFADICINTSMIFLSFMH